MFRKFFVPLLIGILSGWTIGEANGKGPKVGAVESVTAPVK
jgi:hypothetical protein